MAFEGFDFSSYNLGLYNSINNTIAAKRKRFDDAEQKVLNKTNGWDWAGNIVSGIGTIGGAILGAFAGNPMAGAMIGGEAGGALGGIFGNLSKSYKQEIYNKDLEKEQAAEDALINKDDEEIAKGGLQKYGKITMMAR